MGRPKLYDRRVMVLATTEQDEAIRAMAKTFGVPEAAIIRAALDAYLFPPKRRKAS